MTALIKQINPTAKAKINPSRYKKDPLTYLYIELFAMFGKLGCISVGRNTKKDFTP
jgi:hypothetical protein